MIKKILFIILGLTIGFFSFSQNDSIKIEQYRKRVESKLPDSTYWDSLYYDIEKSYGFTIGINQGSYAGGLEFGIGRMNKGVIGYHMTNSGIYFGSEIMTADSAEKLVVAPKIGLWADGGSSLGAGGLNIIYYTNQNEGHIRLRPEIGLGLMGFQIVYGYNIRFGNKKVNWVNEHNVKIIYSFGIFGKKRIQTTNREKFEKYKARKLKK